MKHDINKKDAINVMQSDNTSEEIEILGFKRIFEKSEIVITFGDKRLPDRVIKDDKITIPINWNYTAYAGRFTFGIAERVKAADGYKVIRNSKPLYWNVIPCVGTEFFEVRETEGGRVIKNNMQKVTEEEMKRNVSMNKGGK